MVNVPCDTWDNECQHPPPMVMLFELLALKFAFEPSVLDWIRIRQRRDEALPIRVAKHWVSSVQAPKFQAFTPQCVNQTSTCRKLFHAQPTPLNIAKI